MKYHRLYREYVRAVFLTDANGFLELVKDGNYPNELNLDCNIFPDVALPLHYITICWDIILSKFDEYKEEYRTLVLNKKLENDRIKDYFITQHNLNMENIPFRNYGYYFYCTEEEATADDCLFLTKDELIKKGHREIDIDLYCYTEKFDFENVERLLKEGANPRHLFPEDLDCLSRIGDECAFLDTELADAMFDNNYRIHYEEDIANLIGLAAHEKMYSLLSK